MKWKVHWLILCLVALAVASGCGGGNGDETAPTKEAFIRKANLICAEGEKEKARLTLESAAIYRRQHGHVSQERINQYYSELMDVYEADAEKVAALTPPVGDGKKIEAWASALKEAAKRYEANPEAGGVALVKPRKLAQSYGLDRCV